jgi:hypothetical protein
MRKCIVVLLALAFLSGCQTVSTAVQAFAGPSPPVPGETIAVIPMAEPGQASLEQQSWVPLVEAQLVKRGFAIVPAGAAQQPDLLAIVDMSIDGGRDVMRSYAIPQYGVTGYSTTTIGGVTTVTPQHGITGYTSGVTSRRQHIRTARIRVYRISQGQNSPPIFEVTAMSDGRCGMLASVAPAIIEGMLAEFPKPGARTRSSTSAEC